MEACNFNFSLLLDKTEVDIRFDYSNQKKEIKQSSYSLHHHSVYEIYFIEKGTMSVCFDNDEIELNTHDILLISPNTTHRVNTCSETLERFNFRFLIKTQSTDMLKAPYIICRLSPEEEIFQNIEKINYHIPQIENKWEFYRIKNYFGIIISYIIESLMSQGNKSKDSFLYPNTNNSKIDTYVRLDNFFINNYSKQITVEDLATELSYSKNHINRLLKKYLGVSFSEKLNNTRLKAAKEYLTNTTLSLYQISEKCGYLSLRGFEKFFIKHTGISPGKYRKMHKNKT